MTTQINGSMFADWAGKDLARWRRLLHQPVINRTRGKTFVVAVRQVSALTYIDVRYQPTETRQYRSTNFAANFRRLHLPSELGEMILTDQQAPHELKLDELRKAIQSGRILELEELKWLGRGAHDRELDEYLDLHGRDWPIAKVGAHWRRCDVPESTLDVTKGIERGTTRVSNDAPIWTTRGAAFTDLERMAEAKGCVDNALECDPKSFYPHNLLGRIYRYLGDHDLADTEFDIAEDLGGSKSFRAAAERRSQHGRKVESLAAKHTKRDYDDIPF